MTEKYGEPWQHDKRGAIRQTNGVYATTYVANKRRIVACVNACAGLDLPDDVPAGALTALVEACRPFAALAPAFSVMGGEDQRRDETEVYRAHWDSNDPDGKAVTNGDFRAVAAALTALEVRK